MKNKTFLKTLKVLGVLAAIIGYLAISNQEFNEQTKGNNNDYYSNGEN